MRFILLVLTALLVAIAAPAAAQQGFTSARAAAMGGAASGSGGNGSIYINPAGLMVLSRFSAEAGYHNNGPAGSNSFGLSVIDSKTNPNISAGVAYDYAFGPGATDDDIDDARDHSLRFGAAVPLVPAQVFLGVAGHYTSARTVETVTTLPPVGLPTQPTVTQQASRNDSMTVDIGLMAVIQRVVSIGVTAQNIAQTEYVQGGRRYLGGIGIYAGPLQLELQYAAEQDRVTKDYIGTFAGGAEVTIAQVVPLRIGVQSRGITDGAWITGGLGYRGMTSGVDLTLQQSALIGSDRAIMATILLFR
jgi:hypothetical protein